MRKLKKGDDVIVIAGRDRGKRGAILEVRDNQRLLVDNVNVVKKHQRGNPNSGVTGGIIEKEATIHASNVALYNPITKKADRVGIKTLEDGRKIRVFRSNGEAVDIG